MSFDALTERNNTMTRLGQLYGGRVYPGFVPDEAQRAVDGDGNVLPYILVAFGQVIEAQDARDRSIEGPRQQPYIMPVVVECWGFTNADIWAGAAAVRNLLIDWSPNPDNATGYEARGGSIFPPQQNATGRPMIGMESLTFVSIINMQVDDTDPPNDPEPPDDDGEEEPPGDGGGDDDTEPTP